MIYFGNSHLLYYTIIFPDKKRSLINDLETLVTILKYRLFFLLSGCISLVMVGLTIIVAKIYSPLV